jgi:hypothetical protein
MNLTQSALKDLLDYNEHTGALTWKVTRSSKVREGQEAGWPACTYSGKWYRRIGIDYETYYAHRVIWMIVHGRLPKNQIDHINGDGLDNRLSNLRDVTVLINNKNVRKRATNKSGCTGVHWLKSKKRWVATISADKSTIYLGRFIEKWDAICVRKSAERKFGFHLNHGS